MRLFSNRSQKDIIMWQRHHYSVAQSAIASCVTIVNYGVTDVLTTFGRHL